MLGQLAAQVGESEFELWEENVPVVQIFHDMLTQWNVGPGGVIGLRYEALPVVMRLRRIAAERRLELFEGLRIMEVAALEVYRGR